MSFFLTFSQASWRHDPPRQDTMPTQTRAKRRKTQALLIEQVFSKPAAHILRRLLSFGDPRSLGNVEATGRLLGGRGQVEGEARSLVELAVRDRLAALGRLDLARMEAPRLQAAGEAWSELLLFAMRLPSAPHRRLDGGYDTSLAIKEGAEKPMTQQSLKLTLNTFFSL